MIGQHGRHEGFGRSVVALVVLVGVTGSAALAAGLGSLVSTAPVPARAPAPPAGVSVAAPAEVSRATGSTGTGPGVDIRNCASWSTVVQCSPRSAVPSPRGTIPYSVFLWANGSTGTEGQPVDFTAGFVEYTEANGTLIDHGVAPYRYTWGFSDGTRVTLVSNETRVYLQHTFPCPDYQPVVLWVNDSAGNWASARVDVLISPEYYEWTNASRSVVPTGQPVVLQIQTVGAVPPITIQWSRLPADCAPANTTTLSCASRQVGIYYPATQVTDARGCSQSAFTTFGVVASIPAPQPEQGPFAPLIGIFPAGVLAAGMIALAVLPQFWVSRWRRLRT